MGQIWFSGDNDVEISAGPSADRLAGRGAGQAGPKNIGGASGPLRADRADRGRQAGLLHEMREFAGTASAAAEAVPANSRISWSRPACRPRSARSARRGPDA